MLNGALVKKGDTVQTGDLIAKAGSTGTPQCLICILWYIVMIKRVIDRPFPQNFILQKE